MQSRQSKQSRNKRSGKLPLASCLTLGVILSQSLAQPVCAETTGKRTSASAFKAVAKDLKHGIEAYKLPNGLTVLLVERKTAPVTVVNMVYHVGSRNEAVGYTGSTHFLEHLMFKGTSKHDPLKGTGLDDVLKKVGGINNATTYFDRTNYFEVVPKDSLALALELEADRMRNLLLRKSDRDAEMTVVRNELERGEDEPSDLLTNMTFATAFKEHPYHHPVIGWRSDVEGVPLTRLRKFYQDFYWPDNATLMVIGDFEKSKTLELINQYFGKLPKSPSKFPPVYTKEPPQEGERRFVVSRGKELPRVMIAFHTPEAVSKDTAPLDILSFVLGDSSRKSTRLYKSLIESGLCSECSTSNLSLLDPGLFIIQATVQPGQNPVKVEEVIKAELKRLADKGITEAELNRAKQSIVKRFKLSLSDPMGLAQSLTEGIACAGWQWWCNYPDQVLAVKKAETDRLTSTFNENNRTVGYYLPKGESLSQYSEQYLKAAEKIELPAVALEQSLVEKETQAQDKPAANAVSATPKPDRVKSKPDYSKPLPDSSKAGGKIAPRVERIVLKNGLTVLMLNIDHCQTVAVSGKIRAGDYFASTGQAAYPELLARILGYGTKKFSKEELARKLENMGANLDFSSESFFHTFDSEVTSDDLEDMLKLVASSLMEAKLDETDLKEVQKIYAAQLKEESSQTAMLAWNKLLTRMYRKDSVYFADSYEDQIKQVNETTIDNLRDYYSKHYCPANTVLTLVGDFKGKQGKIKELLESEFGHWQGSARQEIKVTDQVLNKEDEIKSPLVSKLPDKANVDIVLARPVDLSVKAPDYLPSLVANAVLGYDSFACRLAPVRDRYGLTYGIYSRIVDPEYPFAPWSIELSVNPENVKKALKIVDGIVKDFNAKGITQAELDKEKSHLAGTFQVGLRSPRAMARKLSEYEQLGQPLANIDNFPERLSKVGLGDVNKAIAKYFDPKKLKLSVAGNLKGELD